MDIRKIITEEVLSRGHLMSLATVDEGGPWVSDVVYVFDDDLNIYWISKVDARHSRAILKNPQVAGTITVSNAPQEKNVGIQFSGTAEKLEGDFTELAAKHLAKRGKPAPDVGKSILGPGQAWYRIKPDLMELIYESLFGFEKQRYSF
jgi:uncharacterized protein YhbP (UPF0306 family)